MNPREQNCTPSTLTDDSLAGSDNSRMGSCTELLEERAEYRKRGFLRGGGSHCSSARYCVPGREAEEILKCARRVVALNLPSSLLRAAAIFVDYFHGFPPQHDSFFPPA